MILTHSWTVTDSNILSVRSTHETATMAIYLNKVFIFILCCAFFPSTNGNFTIPATLSSTDIFCVDECQFFPENQTITIINITNPKQAVKGVAYHTKPIRMKDLATKTVASFHTSFKFREEPMNYNASPYVTLEQMEAWSVGDGFTFMMSNSSSWKGEAAGRLGIFTSNPNDKPKAIAVEFDSFKNIDTDSNVYLQAEHAGLDIASATSFCHAYVKPLNVSFFQRNVLKAWIEYDGKTKTLELRLANTSTRPDAPLLNCTYDLYDAVDERMWIGFSGAVGDSWSVYYIYDWTFTSFGISNEFSTGHGESNYAKVGLIVGVCGGIALAVFFGVCVYVRKKRHTRDESRAMEGLVDMAGMPEFISYKHLSAATKQFSDQSKLGEGGFGSVYKGVLPKTGAEVAVKKVSNDSRQGEREFLAEVQIISQLRHRNVVQLIGFCRDSGKFLLVYELLPKSSLDRALFKPKTPNDVLSWSQRWKIVSGIAAALHYLHEGWRQQVIHRDVKSSNIMLDDEYNPKLGDFGLARLVDHEKNAATTMVAGTYGYLAPEAAGGKFTDKTDVYAFGAVALEVACGRISCDRTAKNGDDLLLVDLVRRRLKEGEILSVADQRLGADFDRYQMGVVLKLGLLCSHPDPASRPPMRQVVQVLAGEADVPDVPQALPGSDMSQISVDDLLNPIASSQSSWTGGTGITGGKRFDESSTSLLSSVGSSSNNSFGMQAHS